jgi:sulfonate transport system ATP-binding protein
MSASAVRIRDLVRHFTLKGVLNGVDLDIAPGEFVALLGRSGSGKSTLLRALAGIDHEAEGTGEIVLPQRTAVIFQDARLLPWMRVLDNVVLGQTGADARRRGAEALVEVGLAGRERSWPHELSGGEQQRVAIARAVANAPRVLFADEPTGNLDPHTANQVFKALTQLVKATRVAMLIATHNMDLAARMDRRVSLVDGKVVELA